MKRKSLISLGFVVLFAALFTLAWAPAKEAQSSEKRISKESAPATSAELFRNYVTDIYSTAGLVETGLDIAVFQKAITGFINMKQSRILSTEKEVLSIVDFNKSSRTKRFWVVDLAQKKLLYHTLVAHGQGSGDDMATKFSNTPNSHQSSLGFYVTNQTYFGKHGLSLKLKGLDKGFNTNALARAVVVHGASYVSQNSINQLGRLGRSHGCPALPVELTSEIIQVIKNGTCLFINGPESTYVSDYLNEDSASAYFAPDTTMAIARL